MLRVLCRPSASTCSQNWCQSAPFRQVYKVRD
nr:MAG TPA: hypothetical protein [Microviridae sp.]